MNLSLARKSPAVIVQNPRSPVVFDKPFDPREQDVLGRDPVSVRASIDECNRERAEARAVGIRHLHDQPYPLHVLSASERADGLEMVHRLLDTFGAQVVSSWVKNAAAMRGVKV